MRLMPKLPSRKDLFVNALKVHQAVYERTHGLIGHRILLGMPALMLRTTGRILRGLQVHKDRMLENLNSGGGIVFSGRVLLALVESGMGRDDAYAVVQGAAMRAWEGEGGFRELLERDETVRGQLGDELDELFEPAYALRNLGVVFERVEELRGRLEDA